MKLVQYIKLYLLNLIFFQIKILRYLIPLENPRLCPRNKDKLMEIIFSTINFKDDKQFFWGLKFLDTC